MTLTQTHARFEDTSYTLIHALSNEQSAQEAIETIARVYWPPVYAYLRHSGMSQNQAADITQAFFTEKILRMKLLERADPSRGRVRNLLLGALKNFVIDQHRKEVVRGKGCLIPQNVMFLEEDPKSQQDPEAAFNQRWASVQLEESMQRCEAYFQSTGRTAHWQAFEDRIYHPNVHNTTPTPLKLLAPKLGFSSPADVAAAIQLVKRRSISFLHEVVTESTAIGADAEAEYKHILDLLLISSA